MHQVERSPTLSSASLAPSSPPPLDYGSPLASPLVSPLHLPNVRPAALVPALPIESKITKPTSPPGLQGKAIVNPNRPATSTVIRQSSPPAVSNALRFSAGVTQMNQSVLSSRSMQVHLPESRAFTKASIAAASAVAAHATAMLASIDAIAVRPSCLSQAESRSPEVVPLNVSPGHQSPRVETMSPVQFTSAFSARNAESSFHFNKLQVSPTKSIQDATTVILPQKSPKSFTSLTERTFVNATPADSVSVRKTFWSGSESPEPTPRQTDTSKNTRNLAALKLKLNLQSGVMLSARPYEPVGTMPSKVEVTHSLCISDNQTMSALESARALIALHSPGSRSTVAYVHDLPKPTKTIVAPEVLPVSNVTKSSQRPTSAATSVSICIPTVESQFQMPSLPASVPEIPFSRVLSAENRALPELLSRFDSKTPSTLLHSISTLPNPLAQLVSSLNLEQCTVDASNDLNFNRFQTEFVRLESEQRQAVANKAVPQCLSGSKVQPSAPVAPPPPKIPSRMHRRVVQRTDNAPVSVSLNPATQSTPSTSISIAAAKIVHQTAGSNVSAPLVERALTRRVLKALEQPKHNRPVGVEEPIPETQRAQIRVSRADKLRAVAAAVSSEIIVPKYQPSVLCDQIGLSSRVFNTEPVRLLDSFKPVTHTPSTPRNSLMNIFPIPAKSTPRTAAAFEIVGQSAPQSRNPYRLPMTSSMRRHHPQLTGHIMRRHTSFAPHASRPEPLLGALNEIHGSEAVATNENAHVESSIHTDRSREASRSSSALSSNSIRAGSVPRSMFESAIMTASASVAAMTAPMTAAESRIEPAQPNRATRSGISTPRTRESPIKMDSESDVGSPHAPGPGPYLSARKLFRALSNLLPREDEDEPPLPEAESSDMIEPAVMTHTDSKADLLPHELVISTPLPESNPVANESIAPTELEMPSAPTLAVQTSEKVDSPSTL